MANKKDNQENKVVNPTTEVTSEKQTKTTTRKTTSTSATKKSGTTSSTKTSTSSASKKSSAVSSSTKKATSTSTKKSSSTSAKAAKSKTSERVEANEETKLVAEQTVETTNAPESIVDVSNVEAAEVEVPAADMESVVEKASLEVPTTPMGLSEQPLPMAEKAKKEPVDPMKDDGFWAKCKHGLSVAGNACVNAGKTVWRWTKRTFMGASKELTDDEKFRVENIESPAKQMVKTFMRRRVAIVALVVLILMFALVFIGPLFVPMDVNYTDALQQNIAPNYSMRKVPNALKNDIKSISGFSNFTVGVSNSGGLYIWGDTKLRVQGINLADFPEEITGDNVAFAAAGKDHIVAITTDGKVVCWGNSTNGQLGDKTGTGILSMPEELKNGTIDVNNVRQVVCGYQASAIVMKDGTIYVWGNTNTVTNMSYFVGKQDVAKVAFTNSTLVAVLEDGTFTAGNSNSFTSVVSSKGTVTGKLNTYLQGKKVVDVAATNYSIALVLDDGELVLSGAFSDDIDLIPELPEGETFVKVVGGTRHFVVLSSANKAYGWGHNFYGQSGFSGVENVSDIYAGSLQTYLVGDKDNLTNSYGLKGYLMGTDSMGRDIFTRIIHGGKMTMTVGAVAVIVSSIIAIIVGCVSGYFGGWVDMLLMRITEICSAIPFLPFAMMLSLVIRNYNVSETMRIVIIMIMLGLLSWPSLARMIRGQVLAEREKEFVIAAKAMGIKESRIAFKHILPNVISVILVSMTLDFAGCMLTESSLSYLGFGVQQPQPTWGNMLNGANNSIVIQNYWWQWLFPALFLAIATISINIIGDTLRDVMDPKSTQDK